MTTAVSRKSARIKIDKPVAVEEIVARRGGLGRLLSGLFFQYIGCIARRLQKLGYPDIRPAHLKILREIGLGGTNLGAIASKASITKQAASQMVKELVDLGYVRSLIDPANRRSRTIILTERGVKLIHHIRRIVEEMQKQLIGVVGKDDFERLVRSLLKLQESGILVSE
jgi:DNA-binding MarR family transcriptional regulator